MINMNKFIKKFGEFIVDITIDFLIAFSIFMVLYQFIFELHLINGQSMMPNVLDGELLLAEKISLRFSKPKRGDIVIINPPEIAGCKTKESNANCTFIKRVIGLPGEDITITNGKVYINGYLLHEPYLDQNVKTYADKFTRGKTIHLGSDQYFVMGDNRYKSNDSRAWGPVSFDKIVAIPVFVIFPFDKFGIINYSKTRPYLDKNVKIPVSVRLLFRPIN